MTAESNAKSTGQEKKAPKEPVVHSPASVLALFTLDKHPVQARSNLDHVRTHQERLQQSPLFEKHKRLRTAQNTNARSVIPGREMAPIGTTQFIH